MAWFDEGEVVGEDVPQLGEFVEAGAAQPTVYSGNPQVTSQFMARFPFGLQEGIAGEACLEGGFGGGVHGAKLSDTDAAAAVADAFVAKEDWARGVEADEEGDGGHKGQGEWRQ